MRKHLQSKRWRISVAAATEGPVAVRFKMGGSSGFIGTLVNTLFTDYWSLSTGHCAGIVTNGNFPGSPVSARVKKNMTAVRARFVWQSLSLIQNQCPR